jgi:hypothetical protein
MINYNLEDYNDEFVNNNPFPHIYLDNFFDEDIIEEVYNEFPDENSDIFTWKSNDKNSKKLMCQDRVVIEERLPKIDAFIKYLNSPAFLDEVSKLTGIKNLVGDMELAGGGLHQIYSGGFLNVHADFNVSDTMPDHHRRLNIIIYLSKDWEEEYNGQLELWDTELTHSVKHVHPAFNRIVMFNTQPDGDVIAYHGHPTPLSAPDGVTRKSIALYYYTKEEPNNILSGKHKTIYKPV